jgi:hypothetical protein
MYKSPRVIFKVHNNENFFGTSAMKHGLDADED